MNYLNLSHLLVPESRVALQTRFRILQAIATYQPIGRRALAKVVQMSERTLRNECEDMKALDLIEVQGSGMRLTEVGEFILERSDDLKNNFIQMSLVEHKVAKTLGVQYVKVVENPAKTSELVQEIMDVLLPLGTSIIAITGGQTMVRVSEGFTKDISVNRDLTIVPARGGMFGSMLIQANNVSEKMATGIGAHHEALFVPEHVQQATYAPLMQEPSVAKTMGLMKKAECLLYSVGSAIIMGERRGLTQEQKATLKEKKAIGEAFGCFFDAEGNVVLKIPRVGLHLSDLSTIPHSIAVVEGAEKAPALKAYAKLAPVDRTWFVIDKETSELVLNGETRKK